LVDPKDLPNAIALNSIQFNLARVIGPMLGGLALTHLGASWCFSLNGFSFLAVIISLLLLTVRPNLSKPGISLLTSMKEGIGFIRGKTEMVPLIGLAFFMTFLGVPLITFLPVVARDIFHMGASTYTLLLCMSGAGAVAGALLVAAFGHIPNKGQVTLTMLVALGALMAGFAISKSLILTCTLLFLAGAALIAVFSMISSLVQLIAPDEMRGRVMSVYNVAFRGGMPIGSLITGALIPHFGIPIVLAVNGILLSCLGLYFLVVQRQVARL
jgi:predicted MFS family arabinose efflux permease